MAPGRLEWPLSLKGDLYGIIGYDLSSDHIIFVPLD
jgi:hypothetical protein